jgi:hypothetical protein
MADTNPSSNKATPNLSGWDRVVRGLLGFGFLFIVVTERVGGNTAFILLLLGLAFLLNAVSGVCMLYKIMGVTTCPVPPKKPK